MSETLSTSKINTIIRHERVFWFSTLNNKLLRSEKYLVWRIFNKMWFLLVCTQHPFFNQPNSSFTYKQSKLIYIYILYIFNLTIFLCFRVSLFFTVKYLTVLNYVLFQSNLRNWFYFEDNIFFTEYGSNMKTFLQCMGLWPLKAIWVEESSKNNYWASSVQWQQ